MKVVRCPRCGHENRAAISVSICDQCGADISTAPDLNARGDERDLRINPAEIVVEEVSTAAREAPATPVPEPVRPAPPPRPLAVRIVAFVGRLLLAAAAVAVGVAGGLSLRLGTALEADPQLAGSIAILAAASGISGLVLVLVGGSPDRSQSVTWGLRTVGFLLTVLGVWAVTVIAQGALSDYEPGDSNERLALPGEEPARVAPDVPPEMTMPMVGPGMGPGPGPVGPPAAQPLPAPTGTFGGAGPAGWEGEPPRGDVPVRGEGTNAPSTKG